MSCSEIANIRKGEISERHKDSLEWIELTKNIEEYKKQNGL